jgi:hypothetical protein
MPKASHFDIQWQAMELAEPDTSAASLVANTLDFSGGSLTTCKTDLPWPALGAGSYTVTCRICGQRVAATTTGANSDPASVVVACAAAPGGKQYAVAA